MSGKVVQLYDKDGNNIFPITSFEAMSGSETINNTFVQKSGDVMTGNLKVPNLDIANDICRGYIYGETNSLNFRGGNPTTEKYTYLKIAEDGVYIDNQKIYYPGNKPTPSDIGAVNKSGDTMTGKLYTTALYGSGAIGAASNDGHVRIDGGTNYDKGAFLALSGMDSYGHGDFQLVAGDGTNRKEIRGQADGSLTWDGNPIYHAGNKPKFSEIAFLGTNPITSTTNDTTANWASIGSGYAWYNTANQLTNQPSQWGFVISYSQSTDIFQIWNTQAGGPTYFRSGHGAGWKGGWRKVYDTSNITSSTTDLTAGSSSLATGSIYFVYQ